MFDAGGGEEACLNCETRFAGPTRFCPGCGQRVLRGRLTVREVAADAWQTIVGVDFGILSLFRDLLMRPGGVALDWVQGKRCRYFSPLAYVLWMVGLAVAAVALSGFKVFASRDGDPSEVAKFLQVHLNLVPLLHVPLLAGWGVLLFGRTRRNYAEQLVLAAYTSGLRSAVVALATMVAWMLVKPTEVDSRFLDLSLALWVVYFAWASSQFHPVARWSAALKGAAVAVLTHVTTSVAMEQLAGVWVAVRPGK